MQPNVDTSRHAELTVVGGGLAGLLAAWRASQRVVDGRSPKVRVLEAGRASGGVIATVEEAGFRIERAASSIRGASRELLAAIKELGLSNELVPAAPVMKKRWIAHRGRLMPAPAGPLSFFTSPLMSLRAKLRALKEPFVKEAAPRANESLASFVARRFGAGFVDPLFDAVVTGIFAGDARQLEAVSAMPRLAELATAHGSVLRGFFKASLENRRKGVQSEGLYALRGGMQVLVRRLAQELGGAISLNTEVKSLERVENHWALEDVHGNVHRSAEVVLATPSWVSARLLAPIAPELSVELEAIDKANVAVVAFGVRKAQIGVDSKGMGFLVPVSEQSPLLGILYESSLFPERAPTGHVLLRCMLGGERFEIPENLDVVGDLTWREARRYLDLAGTPVMRKVFVHRPGIPQYRPGHARRLARIDEMLHTNRRLSGLKLIGWSYRGISLNDRAKETQNPPAAAAPAAEAPAEAATPA